MVTPTFVDTYVDQPSGLGYAYEDALDHNFDESPFLEMEDDEAGGEDQYFRVLSRGQSVPWFETHLHRIGLKSEQVTYNGMAIELLARLYEEGVLSVSDLGRNVGARRALALAMLAAAGMCDVDPYSVRITSSGAAMVKTLRHEGTRSG